MNKYNIPVKMVNVLNDLMAYSLEECPSFGSMTEREQAIVGSRENFEWLKRWVGQGIDEISLPPEATEGDEVLDDLPPTQGDS